MFIDSEEQFISINDVKYRERTIYPPIGIPKHCVPSSRTERNGLEVCLSTCCKEANDNPELLTAIIKNNLEIKSINIKGIDDERPVEIKETAVNDKLSESLNNQQLHYQKQQNQYYQRQQQKPTENKSTWQQQEITRNQQQQVQPHEQQQQLHQSQRNQQLKGSQDIDQEESRLQDEPKQKKLEQHQQNQSRQQDVPNEQQPQQYIQQKLQNTPEQQMEQQIYRRPQQQHVKLDRVHTKQDQDKEQLQHTQQHHDGPVPEITTVPILKSEQIDVFEQPRDIACTSIDVIISTNTFNVTIGSDEICLTGGHSFNLTYNVPLSKFMVEQYFELFFM